jgi:4a-hydroxytetrahydrobiopterin dehydratase
MRVAPVLCERMGCATDLVRMTKLTAAELRNLRADLPGWRRRGSVLSRTYTFEDFLQAMKFVQGVARAAERAGHHPDIDIRWNRVTLALTTHDAGGLTELDVKLAKRCDALEESLRVAAPK